MRFRDWVSLGFGVAALAASVLAVGGADRWAQALVSVLVAGALAPQLASRRVFERMSPLVAMLGLALAFTALQLVPLPDALLHALDPVGAALRDDGAALAGVSPWRAISLDAPQTLRALAFFVIVLGVAVIALRLAVSERGRYRLQVAVAALCGLTALIVGIHEVFGATSLYGVIDLEQAHPAVIGPLFNENHLGCLMALGAVVSVGLAMYRRQPSAVRVAWLVCSAACGAVAVATTSRGATVALVAGMAVVLGTRLGQKLVRRGRGVSLSRARFATSSFPIAVVAVSGIVVVLYAAAGGVESRFQRTTLGEVSHPKSRFEAWRSSTQLISESPWVGVGREAMESAFTRVHPASAYATYAYVENEYLQAVVDWGIPGALVLALATLWLLRTAMRRWRDGPLAAGALGGLAVVMVQSNFDFGIELLGVAVPITAIASTLAYVPLREAEGGRLALDRGGRIGHVLALVGGAALMFSPATTSLLEDHDALSAAAEPSLDDIHASIARHPLDYYGYALEAETLAAKGDAKAIRLLNHALRLHPTHAGLHLVAARLLVGTGHPDQAAIEFAAALRGSIEPRPVLEEIAQTLSPELASAAIPPSTAFYRPDELVRDLAGLGRRDLAAGVLVRKLENGYDMAACELLYKVALDMEELEVAKDAARLCHAYEPTQRERGRFATLLLTHGDPAGALEQLAGVESWDGRIDQKRAGWQMRCDALGQLHRWDDAMRCLHLLEASGLLDVRRSGDISRKLDELQAEKNGATGSGAGSAAKR